MIVKKKHSVRDIAYRLWQVRSISGVQTTPQQDWYDAERIFREDQGHEELIEELGEKKSRVITQ